MSDAPRNVTRNQLAEFLPNQRLVRAMEQLLKQVNELLPADIVTINRMIQETYVEAALGTSKAQSALDLFGPLRTDAFVNAGAADAKATAALDALNSIARSLDLLAKSPVSKADNSVSADYVDFGLNPKYSTKPGRVHWGSTGTLEIEMGNGNITQQVGEEFFLYGKASSAITKGQLVVVTGTVGASVAVTFAPTSAGLLDPNAILGVATENIALNGFGRVTTIGVVQGINTSGSSVGEVWADGDVLWYNTAFAGGMTKVKPVAPNMKTQTAIVLRAGAGTTGSLQVGVANGSSLGGTDDNVQLGALADKQLLQYDSVAGYWKNVAVSSVGSTAAETHAASSKATPVDADEIPLADSAASFALKKLTWANLKATLATWINGNLIPASFTTLKASGATNLNNTLQVKGTSTAAGAEMFLTATDTVSEIHSSSSSGVPKTLKFYGSGGASSSMDVSGSSVTMNVATVLLGGANLASTTSALTNGAGIAAGTLLNAPVAGNPTKWIAIVDGGTTRYIPSW